MFTTPLALLGLFALPAIVGLHLYRRRYRPKLVSALFLWEAESADPAAGRSREPLRRNASLLLELLVAAALTLAMAGPRILGSAESEHLVVVLDGTASMTAGPEGGPSALTRATAALRTSIADLGPRSRVTLIRSDAEPTVVVGPLAFAAEALESLERAQGGAGEPPAMAASQDLRAALVLADEFARGGEVLLLTDQPTVPGPLDPGLRVRAFGMSAANVGVVAALRSPSEAATGDSLRLVVRSFSPSSEVRELTVRAVGGASGGTLHTKTLELLPDATRAFTLELPAGTPTVKVTIARPGGPDALAADDTATLAPAPRKRLRIASTLDEATTRALRLSERAGDVSRWLELLASVSQVEDLSTAHLVVGRGPIDPQAAPDAWTLMVGERRPDGAAQLSHLIGPFLIDTTHPLLRGVTLDGVVWSTDESRLPPGAPLVLAGALPLVTESIDDQRRRTWRLTLEPERSNLDRSPDWPILLTNAAETRRAALPGPERTSLTLGESFRWRGCPHESLTWIRPSGERKELLRLPDGDLVTPGLDALGRHRFVPDDAEGSSLGLDVGVSHLRPLESDLRGAASDDRPPLRAGLAGATPSGDLSWIDALLLACALALLAVNWWVLRPNPVRRDAR